MLLAAYAEDAAYQCSGSLDHCAIVGDQIGYDAFEVRVLAFIFVERLHRRSPPNARPDDFSRQNPGLRADNRAA